MIQDPKFCPQCGAGLVFQSVGDRTRPVCPDCGFIFYLNPIVAAGALVEQDGRVALVRRGVEPGCGRWSLPSGYVELNESAEEAAVREAWEELHLRIELNGLLNAFSFTNPSSQGVLLVYAAHVVDGDIQAGDDAIEAAWFKPDELPDVAFRQHRQVLRQWQQAWSVVYRLATFADAEVVSLLSQIYAFERGLDYGIFVGSSDRALFVAADQGQIVGFSAVSLSVSGHAAQIEGVFVHPHYRRWGIGTRLVQTCLDFARQQSSRHILVTAPVAAAGWNMYLKLGFHVSGLISDYYAPHSLCAEPALLLARHLISPEK